MKTIVYVLFVGLMLASCKPILIPTASVIQNSQPQPPPPSFVSIPVVADYSSFVPQIRDQFPWTIKAGLYNDSFGTPGPDNGGINGGYEFTRNYFNLNGSGNKITIDFNYAYWLKIRYRVPILGLKYAECGTPGSMYTLKNKVQIDINFKNDWNFEIAPQIVESKSEPGCDRFFGVLFFGHDVNVSELVENKFRSKINEELFPKVKEQLGPKTDIRSEMIGNWQFLQQPHFLGKELDSMFLSLNAEKFYMTNIDLTNNQLKYTIGLKFNPIVSIGNKPSTSLTPLPNWETGNNTNTFTVFCPVDVSYSTIQNAIGNLFKLPDGTFKRFPETGSKYITVERVELDEFGNKLGVRLFLGGSVKKGSYFYLEGTPSFDAGSKLFSISNIEYNASTKNLILDKIVWFANSMDAFKRKLQDDLLKYDLSSDLVRSRSIVEAKLNSQIGTIQFNGSLSNFDLTNVQGDTRKNFIRFYFNLSGQLQGAITKF